MKSLVYSDFSIILVLVLTLEHTVANHVTFNGGNYIFNWTHLAATAEVEFTVEATTTGWVAFGLSNVNSPKMAALDLFIGGVNSGGSPYLEDYYSSSATRPVKDSQNNFTLLSASENAGKTLIKVKRKLVTGDDKDIDIEVGKDYYVAWAINANSDDPTHYHTAKGYGPQKLVLALAAATTTVAPTATTMVTPAATTTAAPVAMTTSVPPTTSPPSFNNEMSFSDGNFKVSWEINETAGEIVFNVTAKAEGYVGLGISKANTMMKEMDVVVGGVDSVGKSYINDYYSTSETTPSEDQQKDFILISAKQTAGMTTLVYKRKIDTGDSKDIEIVRGMRYYIAWSFHKTSDTLVHHDSRGYSAQPVALLRTKEPEPTTATTTASTTSFTLFSMVTALAAAILII